jgi:hypothetical protein
MPTGLTYTTYQSAVATQIPTITSDPNFTAMVPVSIDYAELSIYRDLDFLALHGSLALGAATVGINTQAVPTGVVVLESLFYGTNNVPATPASQDYIRTVYAGASNGPPECFAVTGAATGAGWVPALQVLLGPAPDQTYTLTGYGTERQAPLSATNTTTWISQNLPDLFFAAAMIFWSGYNRNFGAQQDDPRQAVSWLEEYCRILEKLNREETRKKFMAQDATARIPQQRADARGQQQ